MADILILVFIGFIWLVFKGISAAGDASSRVAASSQQRQQLTAERNEKYKDRVIDTSKSLLERNMDIINQFEKHIKAVSPRNNSYGRYRSYSDHYIENETRDCLNEIALAEDKIGVRPGTTYLTNWQPTAPKEWVELSKTIQQIFTDQQKHLQEQQRKVAALEQRIARENDNLGGRVAKRKNPASLEEIHKRNATKQLIVSDLAQILTPNEEPWLTTIMERAKETSIIKFPVFEAEMESKSADLLNAEIARFNAQLDKDALELKQTQKRLHDLNTGYKNSEKEAVIKRLDYILNDIELPKSVPQSWNADFDEAEGIAIVEVKLPDVVHEQVFKKVSLKTGVVLKPLNQKEIKENVPNFHPAVLLRVAYEIFRNDNSDTIKLLVVNGWVEFDDPSTGNKTKTYTASLAVKKEQIINLNLSKLEPVSAFAGLKGKSAGKLIDIIPVSPMLSLERKDKRFIETRDVLGKLDTQTNLASMDWQDFENLIAELFQKEFSEEGTEIKLTQSSRDKGVDAIVINPDPIRGGKYVIQAKRYTNTVDVSAVRDLVAVVAHEGASRGILVTTSTFGADAYAFVQNKPITLLDGAKLLGLLEKHNYKFKINLAEARKLNLANEK